MSAPTSLEEYERRFAQSHKVSGHGFGVTVHVPCPACAAPDFEVHKIIDAASALESGATCKECKRGFKAIYTRTRNSVSFEIVQTEGDDLPSWLPPIRRGP